MITYLHFNFLSLVVIIFTFLLFSSPNMRIVGLHGHVCRIVGLHGHCVQYCWTTRTPLCAGLLDYTDTFVDYDPLLVGVGPSNPWMTDDLSIWEGHLVFCLVPGYTRLGTVPLFSAIAWVPE